MHVVVLEALKLAILIHLSRLAQITLLKDDKTPTKILFEYADFTDIFSSNLVMRLLENIDINNHTIKLVEDKQSLYRLIYTLSSVDLKTLKTYIKTHLKTGFILSSKSPIGASILFDKKSDGSFFLCIN